MSETKELKKVVSKSKLLFSYENKEKTKKINILNENIQTSSSSNEEDNNKTIENFNNGRWSDEEHKKFLEGILEYGNEWKKVQKIIKTRSSTQARSHAQKFFLKIKKNLNDSNNNLNIDFNEMIKYIVSVLKNNQFNNINLSHIQKEKLDKIINCKNKDNNKDNLKENNLKIKLDVINNKNNNISDNEINHKSNLDIICKKRKREKSISSQIFSISKNSSHKNSFESNLNENHNLMDFDDKKNAEEKNNNNKNPFILDFKIFKDDEENNIFKFDLNEKENNCFRYNSNDYLNNDLLNLDNNCSFEVFDKNICQDFSLLNPQNLY